jgi:hypothetical protein
MLWGSSAMVNDNDRPEVSWLFAVAADTCLA